MLVILWKIPSSESGGLRILFPLKQTMVQCATFRIITKRSNLILECLFDEEERTRLPSEKEIYRSYPSCCFCCFVETWWLCPNEEEYRQPSMLLCSEEIMPIIATARMMIICSAAVTGYGDFPVFATGDDNNGCSGVVSISAAATAAVVVIVFVFVRIGFLPLYAAVAVIGRRTSNNRTTRTRTLWCVFVSSRPYQNSRSET